MKIEAVRKLTHNRHLNLFEIDYRDRRDNQKQWLMSSRREVPRCRDGQFTRPDAVVIVPYHLEQRKLVLIREYRIPLGDYQYGFPAGLVDAGETSANTCRRELYEETGLSLVRCLKTSPPIYSSPGMTDESVAMAFVECSGEASNRGNESSEDISVHCVSPAEASTLCRDEKLRFDAKAWIVLSMYAQHGPRFLGYERVAAPAKASAP